MLHFYLNNHIQSQINDFSEGDNTYSQIGIQNLSISHLFFVNNYYLNMTKTIVAMHINLYNCLFNF